MKKLLEKKNNLLTEMEGMLQTAKTEVRAFTDAEDKRIEEIKTEIRGIEKLIQIEEETRSFEKNEIAVEGAKEARSLETETEAEERAFVEAIKNGEIRELKVGSNGGIIPVSIANKIIDTVKEMCPIIEMADLYNITGDLKIPKYSSGSTIEAAYVTEFSNLSEKAATFTTVDLTNQIIGVLTKISKSLINRAGFDVQGFIVNKVAKAVVEFLEKEMLVGNSKIKGIMETTTAVTASGSDTIKAEDLIDLQMKLKTAHQANACWIMHSDVLRAIRKLKDGQGNFLLNQDMTSPFGWTILGKPVYLSDSMPNNIATSQPVMAYADLSGYAVKIANNIEVSILQEKYAAQYALGICAFMEVDGKVADETKIAKLVMA